jgi:hypothetical protein
MTSVSVDKNRPARSAWVWTGVAILVLFAGNALHTMADPDLWGHLRFGLAHREEGRLARVDPYSYTAPGAEWTNHEWLTEWSFAAAYSAGGAAGLMVLRGLLLAAAFTAVGVICYRRKLPPMAVLVLAIFGITVMSQFFRVRPQMFTYAAMAWLLVICDGHRPGKRVGLCLVPLLILAWTNLHAGFVAGLGVFGVFWLSFVVEAWRSERSDERTRELKFLGAVMAACWAATLVNPYGIDYWRYVLFAVTLPRPAITEWRSVFTHNGVLQACYLASAIVPAALWLASSRKRFWAETAVFAIGVVLAGRHVRHLPFLMLFGSLVYARRIPEVWAVLETRLPRRPAQLSDSPAVQPTPWPALAFLLLLLMAGVGGGWKLGRNLAALPQDGALVVSTEDYPVQAIEFMLHNGVAGNLDCGFNWGEYCIFKLHPQCRVFCDGRYETVYPAEVAELALATEGEEHWRRRVENYPTEVILAPKDDKFAAWAAEREDFVEVYRDDTARLLLRRTPRNAGLIEAWRENRLNAAKARAAATPFPA